MKRLVLLLATITYICIASTVLADIYNPKPYADDLILPMPDNAEMAFRPVFIGEGDKPFALKEFKVGDRAGGGFKEYPTNVVVGGSFIATGSGGQKDWVYYIGKYEVTEAQYYTFMEPKTKKGTQQPITNDPDTKKDSQQPITNISWFDAQEFIKKYNLWLFKNAKDKLPKNEDSLGFLRLPTEIEWEFAARGGSKVDATHFDKPHPYPGTLPKYEWFAGPSSSHGKLKDIGILEPNDLKIHDMLGNVSEMTETLYRIEYYQGRAGGFVARGGHSFTSEDKIRSSMREEIPYYKLISNEMIPTRQPTLGLRLLISSQIYASRNTSKYLADAWDDYRKGKGDDINPTNIHLADAVKALKRIENELNNMQNVSQTIWDKMGLLKASFGNIEATVKKAEHDSAFAWVKVASETAYLIYSREMKALPARQRALDAAKELGKSGFIDSIQKQIDDIKQNIKGGLESYGFYFMQLEKIEKESVEQGFEKYKDFLVRRSAAAQIRFTQGIVKKHYDEYFRDRRLNIEKWKADMENF